MYFILPSEANIEKKIIYILLSEVNVIKLQMPSIRLWHGYGDNENKYDISWKQQMKGEKSHEMTKMNNMYARHIECAHRKSHTAPPVHTHVFIYLDVWHKKQWKYQAITR